MKHSRCSAWSWLVVLGIALGGCAFELQDGEVLSDQPYDDDVAVQSAGLGSISTLLNVPATRVVHLTSSMAVLTRDATSSCADQASIWRVTTSGNTTPGYGCAQYTTGGGDGTAFVFDDRTDDILRYDNALVKLADTNGAIFGPLAVDSTWVYWCDLTGFRRVPRNGGAVQTIYSGQGYDMLGLENGVIYFQKNKPNYYYELWTMDSTGEHPKNHIVERVRFKDFAVRNGVVHWVNNTQTPHRITTYDVNNRILGDVISTKTSDEFRHPTPAANGNLYFVHKSLSGFASVKIRRITNKEVFDEVTLGVEVLDMAAGSSSLMWVEDWVNNKSVRRAPF